MPEFDQVIYEGLVSHGLKQPERARWVKMPGRCSPIVRGIHLRCRRCVWKPIELRHVIIQDKSLGIAQCTNCKTIHWCPWHVIDVSVGSYHGGL